MDPVWTNYVRDADPQRRSFTPKGAWNIPLAPQDLKVIGNRYAESLGIPTSHNRKFEDAATVGMVIAIAKAARPSKRPLNVGDWVYYRRQYNRGNKKYPDIISLVSYGRIEADTPKTYLVGGYRVSHEYVIGRITKGV